ncbi:MAG: UbiA family prenyltransferase [Nitrososphaerales archaeon]|nr:UbiA family prenyltransferase [Nitrososphaerales archaeon]
MNFNLIALLSLIRPINSFMIGLAVVVGIAIGSPDMLFSRLTIYGFITGFSISSYSMIINDIYDIEIDKVNQPERPLAKQIISINSALSLSLILLLIGLTSSLIISYYNIIITAIFSFLSWFYNIWGKKQGIIGNSIVASSMSIPFIFGGIMTGNVSLLVWSISLIAFLSGMGREIIKTIADVEGDKIKGIKSVSIQFGPRNAMLVACGFIIISILISFIPVYLNLIQIYYIPLLILTDLILIYSVFLLSKNYSKSESLKVKKYILYAMLFGLITFLANSMIVW